MILVIDNYDSFTYNLVQFLGERGEEVEVRSNDKVTLEEVRVMHPERIVISPGPGEPGNAGICLKLLRHFGKSIPILGVCLGHQAIGEAFGGKVIRASVLMHGKASEIFHDGKSVYRGIRSPMTAGRYHSLIVERETLPECLEVSAETRDGFIMGLRHRDMPTEGVQFHPESILTPEGKKLLDNFCTS
jgi:para-aminobenzoate synthetase component II